jgi:hypothetical protein
VSFPAIVTSVGSVVQGKIAHRQPKLPSAPPGREFRLKHDLGMQKNMALARMPKPVKRSLVLSSCHNGGPILATVHRRFFNLCCDGFSHVSFLCFQNISPSSEKGEDMANEMNFFAEDPGRYERCKQEFTAQGVIDDVVDVLLERHADALKLRDGEENDLSRLVGGFCFAKAHKTFWLFRCLISASIHAHFEPILHESSSDSRG